MIPKSNSLVWFRRDLRAFDHAALHHALRDAASDGGSVYCAFVFDTDILAGLPRDDRRVRFIHACLVELDAELRRLGGGLIVRHGAAREVIPLLAAELNAGTVYVNGDYEPGAIERDAAVAQALEADGRRLLSFKDGVVFEKSEVLTLSGGLYSVFTPYKNAWLKRLAAQPDAVAPWMIEPYAAALAPARTAPCRPWPISVSMRVPCPLRPACPAQPDCSRLSCRAWPTTARRATSRCWRHLAAVDPPALRHDLGAPPGAHAAADDGARRRRRGSAGVAVGAGLARVLRDDPVPAPAHRRARVQAGIRCGRVGNGRHSRRSCSRPGARAAPVIRWWMPPWRS
jgi:hypothetical protein